MSRARIDAMTRRLVTLLSKKAKDRARPLVRRASRHLAANLKREVFSPRLGRLYIPHYWAVFVNDGRTRMPVLPKAGQYLIWFRNPKKDPRLAPFGGRSPQRFAQWRRLTKPEVAEARKLNRAHINRGGSRSTMPVIFAKAVRKPTPGKRFFENDPGKMKGVVNTAHGDARREMSKLVIADVLGGQAFQSEIMRVQL